MDIEKINADFARITAEASAINEIQAERELTAEEKTELDGKFAALDRLNDAKARYAKLEAAFEAAKPVEKAKVETKSAEYDVEANFNGDLSAWMVGSGVDAKFATVTTATSNSLFLPKSVKAPETLGSVNAFRSAIESVLPSSIVKTSTTGDLNVPILSANSGGKVAEDASSETENVPSFADSITLNVDTYQSGSVWFSDKSLYANDYDLLNESIPSMYLAKEVGLETDIATVIKADAGVTQKVTLASTAATSLTYAKLVELNRKLPARFDRFKAIFLHADAYAAAEGLLGSDNHPALVIDPQNGSLIRFNGTPIYRLDSLDTFGATNKVVGLVVSMLGMRIRDAARSQLVKYAAQPSRPGQTGANLLSFNGFGYSKAAVAKLVTAAS